MSQNDFTRLFGENFTKGFSAIPGFSFNINSWMETQRKNVQALTEAQQLAFEGIQAIAQRQAEILSQFVEDNSALAQEIMSEGTPEQKISKQADVAKKSYEKTVANWNELAEMVRKSNLEAAEIINKRVSATLTELKSAIDKNGASNANAAAAARKKAA